MTLSHRLRYQLIKRIGHRPCRFRESPQPISQHSKSNHKMRWILFALFVSQLSGASSNSPAASTRTTGWLETTFGYLLSMLLKPNQH